MDKGKISENIEASRAASAALQSAVDEHTRVIAAAEKALATAKRAQAKHAALLASAEQRCLAAAKEADRVANLTEASMQAVTATAAVATPASVDKARQQMLEGLATGPARQSSRFPGRLAGGIVTLVVEGEPLVVHARVLAGSPYFAARLARWDESTEPLRLEIPTAGVADVHALLERLYVGPRSEAWRVTDVASGFRLASVCSLLMLDDFLPEVAAGIRRVASAEDIEKVRAALSGQQWPQSFVHALEDLAAQRSSIPEPDALTEMVQTAASEDNANRSSVNRLLAAWRGGLCAEAVADGLLNAVNAWTSRHYEDKPVVTVAVLDWVLTVVAEYLTPMLATDVFAAFAGNVSFAIRLQKGTWALVNERGRSQQFKGCVELMGDMGAGTGQALVSHLDDGWTQAPQGTPRQIANSDPHSFYDGRKHVFDGLARLRRAFINHLHRCDSEDQDSLKRMLDIALHPCPPRFPGYEFAASPQGQKRRKISYDNASTWDQQNPGRFSRTDYVHGLYLGPVPEPRGCARIDFGTFDKDANCFIWGPQQLRILAGSSFRNAVVRKLASCNGITLAHVLEAAFLSKLEVDEQKTLLAQLGKWPTLLRKWVTCERVRSLALPAQRHVGMLLLPAVATLDADVQAVVLSLALD